MGKATPQNQMIASLLAQELQTQLEALDAGEAAGTWFAAASRTLSPKDLEKFVAACRKRLERLRHEADGCPPRIFGWTEHFGTK